MPDLARCTSIAECLDVLAREAALVAARGAPGAWVLAHGARAESWAEARWPSVAELDRAVGSRPCAVMSFDHHAVAANALALAAAGIDERTSDPADGVVCRDARTGALTGLLLERSAHQVWNAAPEPGPGERREQVKAALRNLESHGYAEVHDMLAQAWLGPLLASLHDAGELALRVELYVPLDSFEDAVRTAREWERPGLRLAGAKVFADGTLNSRTAWMLEPYRDAMPGMERGKPLMTVHQIAGAIERCRRHRLELAAHAIGDGAVRAVLDAVELANSRRERGDTVASFSQSARPVADAPGSLVRIEHCELIDERDVPRFAQLGVMASVQPCHLLYDIEALRRYLPHRLERVLPLRELMDSGCRAGELLWFGSDVPIVRPDPGDSIGAAVNRRRVGMGVGDAIAPRQAIREAEAWACFTPSATEALRVPPSRREES